MGLAAGLFGALVAAGAVQLLPSLLAGLLPFEANVGLSVGAVALGVALGVSATVLFALLPLIGLRRVSPLRVLRVSDDAGTRDPLRWVIYALVALGVFGFAYTQAGRADVAAGYAAGVAAVLGILGLVARGLAWIASRVRRPSWPFALRQGVASLHRPRNQTVLLLVALGLGTFLVATLAVVQSTLAGQVELSGESGRPNLIFFDVQPDQRAGVAGSVRAAGLPVIEEVPVVTMRLTSIGGTPVATLREDNTRGGEGWALEREYLSLIHI